MTTTEDNLNKQDIIYLNELEVLHKNYTEQNLQLLNNFEDVKLGEEIEKLNNWYDIEKQKLLMRSKIREGAFEIEKLVEHTKDDLVSAWETLKNNVVQFFTTTEEVEKKESSEMWEKEAQNVQYMEQIKTNMERQQIRDMVQQEMLNIYLEKEASKQWIKEAEDVSYLENVKKALEEQIENEKIKTNSLDDEVKTVSPNQQEYIIENK